MTVRSMIKRVIFGAWTYCLGDRNGRVSVIALTGPARGLRFRLDLLGNYETRYLLGNYESNVANRLGSVIKPGSTVWDVGTYIGYYTCLFARLVGKGGKVAAIDADPRNLERTRENAALNRFDNVTCIPAAIGAPNFETELLIDLGTNTHLTGTWIGAKKEEYESAERYTKVVKVRCRSLDQLLVENHAPSPDVIKLDIDGAEALAFQYMEVIPKTVRPLFIVELHNPRCDEAAWHFANRWNYHIERVETGEPLTSSRSVGGNILMTPRPAARLGE